MRSSLIAGGALLAAAALFGSASPAAADIWTDWNHTYPKDCGLGLNEDTTYHHVTHHGVFAGTRDADGCKGGSHGNGYGGHKGHGGYHGDDGHWADGHYTHRNWPNSGNGNWVGHGIGHGVGVGVGD
ncbi:hypothetical protein SAMN05444920_11496 [Nonomuraea solani]|uniref:Uncharacterized protein n=1 Tax=Nonomuraea solani TaxID=1144553 RepID=A0A1H6EPM2_9ACTN|nr:hypothetical protein [Nonomuraea solani]SEG99820.1 hypothetical protein SAMN05444920_11496 [Nonomuraea solani]